MPLTPHYTWSETEASLEVTVDVPGVSRAKADVFASDTFLKVNCPPYLFALDLHKEVDDSRSSATIIPPGVVFKLFKREPGLWGCLAATGDKAGLTQRRNESIDRAYRAVEEARKARLARKEQEDKNATQRSMEVDRRKRQEVDRRKAAELAEERGRLADWQQGLQGGDAESEYEDEEGEGAGEEEGQEAAAAAAAADHADYHGKGWRPPKAAAGAAGAAAAAGAARSRSGWGSAGGSDDGDDARGQPGGDDDDDNDTDAGAAAPASSALVVAPRPVPFKPLPPPRARLEAVQVSFTKLETGHLPAREQREEEIRAVRKQVRPDPAPGDSDSVDLAERQPLFLKDKGDGLFRAGNFSGALNAYSRAISLDDCHPAVRANRAACRLALQDAAGCVADCDRAMELLAEQRGRMDRDALEAAEAAALRRQLVRLLVRRAQARAALGGGGGGGGGGEQLAGALQDYEEAMRLAPSDPSLESDYQELVAALRPADAAALRQRGDARFRSGDYEGAAEAFSALLGLPRSRVLESERLAAFSNRAACQLVLERYSAAVADCDAGLALLLPPAHSPDGGALVGGPDFGAAAGEQGLARLTTWAQSLELLPPGAEPPVAGGGEGDGEGVAEAARAEAAGSGGSCGLAPAAAAAAASRLLTRRGAAAAHLQLFAAAAADYGLASELLRRLGEDGKAAAAAADAEGMLALAEGREQLPPRPQPLQPPPAQQLSGGMESSEGPAKELPPPAQAASTGGSAGAGGAAGEGEEQQQQVDAEPSEEQQCEGGAGAPGAEAVGIRGGEGQDGGGVVAAAGAGGGAGVVEAAAEPGGASSCLFDVDD